MKLIHALALFAATLCTGAHAVDVYKWTDSKGVVHYGDHPPSGVATSTVSVPDGGDSPEERAAAAAKLDAERARLAEPAASNVRHRSQAQPVQNKPAESSCAAAWRQYDAAQACFDAHRTALGKGVSESGTVACKELPQPGCAR
jgi:hypothetical protein